MFASTTDSDFDFGPLGTLSSGYRPDNTTGGTGTIEQIGMRTTRVRTLDRTVIAVPNSVFADKEIENWASCEKMLIRNVIGLRYETTPDQMRHVLAKLREMLLAHPRIDSETVRVRFIGYGASSLDVEISVCFNFDTFFFFDSSNVFPNFAIAAFV